MKERVLAAKFRAEMRDALGSRVHVKALIDARNTQLKPYDSYAVRNGKFFAFEFKLIRGGTINCNIMRNNQLNGLFEVQKAGGYPLIALFFEKKEFRNTMQIIPLVAWYEMFGYDINDAGIWEPKGKKSMKVESAYEESSFSFSYTMNRKKVDGFTRWANFERMFDYIEKTGVAYNVQD